MSSVAKPVVKNKYWIVEDNGTKIATIQAIDEGGFAYVHDEQRERFPTIKLLSKKYNIIFDTARQIKNTSSDYDCYGFACSTKPYNQVWDVKRSLPVFSKEPKSKSLFCAGYYVVKYNNSWVGEFCPKNITVSRYEFHGPYRTVEEQNIKLRELNGNHQHSN